MKHQRAHALRVEWQMDPGGQPAAGPVVVRPTIAGALVTPAEQILAPGGPPAEFHVTPVALGNMPEARVDLTPLAGGRTTVPLPMKSVRQRLTKVLLVLAVVVPALLLYFTKYERLEGTVPLFENQGQVKGPRAVGPAPPGIKPVSPSGGGVKAAPNRQRIEPGPARPMRRANPGEVLKGYIIDNVPAIPGVTEPVAAGIGAAYYFLCAISEQDPLAFYVGVLFLVLAGASWLSHRRAAARRRSNPLALARMTPEGGEASSGRKLDAEAFEQTLIEPVQG
jgi:hypothetical protein